MQRQTVSRLGSRDGRRSGPVGKQRHFAEYATRTDATDFLAFTIAALARNNRLACRHDEEGDSTLPFSNDDCAWIVVSTVCDSLDAFQLGGCEISE